MKPFVTMVFLFITITSFSQCLPNNLSLYGAYDFTNELYRIEKFVDPSTNSSNISYLKDRDNDGLPGPGHDPNFKDPKYPPLGNSEGCNVAPYNCNLDDATISYVVYHPMELINTGADATGCKFPAIILFHGGGFADCKSGGDAGSNLELVAQEFAKRGYVAFVVQYRTGTYIAPPVAPNQFFLSAQQSLAEYRAFQDARGAIRSIIYHQTQRINFPNDNYQIDINRIFLGGNSAGSVIALHTAYYNALQIADVFPTPVGPNFPTIADALGPVDIDYYYGAPNIDYQSKVKGVLDMWGQLNFPVKYAATQTTPSTFYKFWADRQNTNIPPIISFHGNEDKTLPIGQTAIRFAPNKTVQTSPNTTQDYTFWNSESHCLLPTLTYPYTLDQVTNSIDLYGQGSQGIYNIFKALFAHGGPLISDELYIDCDMVHGLDGPDDVINNGGVFRSNFGTTLMTADDVNVYIVIRATTYFQAVLTGKNNQLPLDIFYDWVNNRVQSNLNINPDPNSLQDCPAQNCNKPCPPTSTITDPNE